MTTVLKEARSVPSRATIAASHGICNESMIRTSQLEPSPASAVASAQPLCPITRKSARLQKSLTSASRSKRFSISRKVRIDELGISSLTSVHHSLLGVALDGEAPNKYKNLVADALA